MTNVKPYGVNICKKAVNSAHVTTPKCAAAPRLGITALECGLSRISNNKNISQKTIWQRLIKVVDLSILIKNKHQLRKKKERKKKFQIQYRVFNNWFDFRYLEGSAFYSGSNIFWF